MCTHVLFTLTLFWPAGAQHADPQMPEFCRDGDAEGSDSVPPWLKVVLNAIDSNDEVEATNTQHLWAMIVAHTDLFYPYRHLLADWLVKSIGRVLGQVNPQVRLPCGLKVTVTLVQMAESIPVRIRFLTRSLLFLSLSPRFRRMCSQRSRTYPTGGGQKAAD